ncbi:MAG: NAD(P)/FAD-dependent oxidoreductase, partial [Acidimicrobiales bacterium]
MSAVDVAVVGRGMIGAAAARHLVEAGFSCAVIGQAEPDEWADAEARRASSGPFSSHNDEGRITRVAGRTMVWAELASRAISRYHDIAARSGVAFHSPAGLVVSVAALDDWIDAGLIMGSDIRKVEHGWVQEQFGIELSEHLPVAYEGPPAGYINPRRLVAAQSALATHAGATVIDGIAESVERNNGRFDVGGSWGSTTADRVLLATGGFGASLLEGELQVDRHARTIVLGETETAAPLPSLIVGEPTPGGPLAGIYTVPPVTFPDGRRCLKIGGTLFEDRVVNDADALIEHFHGDGDGPEIEALEASMRALYPGVAFTSFTSRPCVIT